jgi:hypothetical protein
MSMTGSFAPEVAGREQPRIRLSQDDQLRIIISENRNFGGCLLPARI